LPVSVEKPKELIPAGEPEGLGRFIATAREETHGEATRSPSGRCFWPLLNRLCVMSPCVFILCCDCPRRAPASRGWVWRRGGGREGTEETARRRGGRRVEEEGSGRSRAAVATSTCCCRVATSPTRRLQCSSSSRRCLAPCAIWSVQCSGAAHPQQGCMVRGVLGDYFANRAQVVC